jgi:SAM-dependent methyltransferase
MNDITTKHYRNEVLEGFSLGNYEAAFHLVEKANSRQIIEQVFTEYGLLEGLTRAKAEQRQLSFIDVGCCEGLFLHDLADTLDQHGLLGAADLNGADVDNSAIATAEEFARVVKPPRPYLNFYVHDIRQPFETQPGLFVDRQPYFDFIFARSLLAFLPHSHQNLTRLYTALAPGGVLYLRDIVYQQGEAGWLSPHPSLTSHLEMGFGQLEALNGGVQVAIATADWLREAGASLVQAIPDKLVLGGASKTGMDNLGDFLMGVRNSLPAHIAAGWTSQVEADRLMDQLYRELGPQCHGQQIYIETFARKPA